MRVFPRLQGWIDAADAQRVIGWATGPVKIRINSALYTELTPSDERADLAHGRGFDIAVPQRMLRQGRNTIEVAFSETEETLREGKASFDYSVNRDLVTGYTLALLSQGDFAIEGGYLADGRLVFNGRIVNPPGVAHADILLNGRPIESARTPDEPARLHFALPPRHVVERFSASVPMAAPMRIGLGDGNGPFNALQDWIVAPHETLPLPDAARMMRVAATHNPFQFDLQGASNSMKLRALYERADGVPLAQAQVLDWGVGCGRVARHMLDHAPHFHGADIDADNIAWCAAHLPGAYVRAELEPPLPFADGAFDFIYGISVLTHLSERHEAAWLAELRRISSPKARLILSVLGARAMATIGRLGELLASEGFLDFGNNADLAGHAPDGYYRNIAHTESYLHRVWGRWFEIIEIAPKCIGNLQDAIVLRPR
ncbi:MAG: class I SAM-dependent methyltransferase [Hyphomonadaceae bacterium]